MSNVTLLAHTVLTLEAEDILSRTVESHADHLAELSGRQCYESFDRPNEKTSANADYLANVIRQNHTSVLAHASFTFRFTDVSRSLTHELIRHRFLAFSELSQRYVDMSDVRFVLPPAFLDYARELGRQNGTVMTDGEIIESALEAFEASYFPDVREAYAAIVDDLQADMNLSRKEARQAARAILPNCTETKIVVSGNVRAWRDFIVQRDAPGADAEIREVAGKVLAVLAECAPNSVADLVAARDPGLKLTDLFDNQASETRDNVPTPGQQLEIAA